MTYSLTELLLALFVGVLIGAGGVCGYIVTMELQAHKAQAQGAKELNKMMKKLFKNDGAEVRIKKIKDTTKKRESLDAPKRNRD